MNRNTAGNVLELVKMGCDFRTADILEIINKVSKIQYQSVKIIES